MDVRKFGLFDPVVCANLFLDKSIGYIIVLTLLETIGKLSMLWGIFYIFYWKNKELLLIHETYDKRPAEVFDSLRSEIISDKFPSDQIFVNFNIFCLTSFPNYIFLIGFF